MINTTLTTKEQSTYDECLKQIKTGPNTPQAIGEALWFILTERLYRGEYDSMKIFFEQCAGMDSEAGFQIIEQWEQTPRGQEITKVPLVKSVGDSAPGLEPMDAKGSFAQSKTQVTTTDKATEKAIHQPIDEQIAGAQNPEQEEPNGSKSTPTVTPKVNRIPATSVAAPSPAVTMTAKNTKLNVALGSKSDGQRKKTTVPKDEPPTGEPVKKSSPTRVQPDADGNTQDNEVGSAPKAGKTDKQSGADLGDGKSDITIPDLATGKTVRSKLNLSEIKKEMGVQSRAAINKAVVAEYAERIKEGDQFPPLVVFNVDGNYILADGFHRHAAAEMAGLEDFAVEIRQGTRKDAIRFSIEANNAHGLPRTNEDKRRAVELALNELSELSDRLIAGLCRVSHPFVGEIRGQLVTVTSSETRVGQDGKRRKQPNASPSGQEKKHPSSRKETNSAAASNPEVRADEEAAGGDESRDGKPEEKPGNSAFFSTADAWGPIEDFLFSEIKKWPQSHHWLLGDKLHKFADLNCH
jgi:hypothetical protein